MWAKAALLPRAILPRQPLRPRKIKLRERRGDTRSTNLTPEAQPTTLRPESIWKERSFSKKVLREMELCHFSSSASYLIRTNLAQ